jgi:hypothetical protein
MVMKDKALKDAVLRTQAVSLARIRSVDIGERLDQVLRRVEGPR